MEYSGDCHVLINSPALVKLETTDAAANLTAATVTINRIDGSTVVTDASAVNGQYTLTAAQTAQLDTLVLTWSFTYSGQPATAQTRVEIIGAWLFLLTEARNFDQKQLTNATTYPDAVITAARSEILKEIGEYCGVSFVPAYKLLYGYLNTEVDFIVLTDNKITKLRSIDFWVNGAWSSQATSNYKVDGDGVIYGFFPSGMFRVGYEYGYTTPPLEIKRTGLKILLSKIIPSNLPSRALSYDIGGSTYKLSVANGDNRPYGLPDVDSVLVQYRRQVIG
jgi:hypothetical protein